MTSAANGWANLQVVLPSKRRRTEESLADPDEAKNTVLSHGIKKNIKCTKKTTRRFHIIP